MNQLDASRRLFLRHAGAMSGLLGASAAPLALNLAAVGSAAAQAAPDYKALVCLFLFGGNDSLNMVLPTDAASWPNYAAVRNQAPDSIALLAPGIAANAGAAAGSPARLGGVLPIAPNNAQGRSFALHPVMGSLQAMFNSDKRLAIVPNVGPLIMPTTKAQYAQNAHPKPASLFSHNDQQNTWQAMAPEGATRGWGGRMGDALAGMNGMPVFTSISASGNAVWLAGDSGAAVPGRQQRRDPHGHRFERPRLRLGRRRPGACSASSPARAATTCSSATWPRSASARSTPRWRCAAR